MEKKMTYVVAIENAINGNLSTEVVDRLADLKASLEKRSANKKATKVQTENIGIKELVVSTLKEIGSGTVTDIQNANAELGELSNQKVSALLRQLVADEVVVKTTDKKKSIFSLA